MLRPASNSSDAHVWRSVWNAAQRERICLQSGGSVASVQSAILLSMGTSTARVMTRTATMSARPAVASHAAAVEPARKSMTTTASPTTIAAIINTAIGRARFSIMCLPSVRKVAAS